MFRKHFALFCGYSAAYFDRPMRSPSLADRNGTVHLFYYQTFMVVAINRHSVVNRSGLSNSHHSTILISVCIMTALTITNFALNSSAMGSYNPSSGKTIGGRFRALRVRIRT